MRCHRRLQQQQCGRHRGQCGSECTFARNSIVNLGQFREHQQRRNYGFDHESRAGNYQPVQANSDCTYPSERNYVLQQSHSRLGPSRLYGELQLPIQNVTETKGTVVNEVATSGVICYNSLDTSQSSSVTFLPGYTYYIVGNFTTGGGAPISGQGVTFYVGGTVNVANGVTSNLSAPTVGTNPAVPQTLFYAMGNTVTIQGGSNSNFSGLVYAPNAAVTLNNGTGTTLNMDFVSQTLSMSGGATLNS